MNTTPETSRGSPFQFAVLSRQGQGRPANEDAYGYFEENPETIVFAVADGLGGFDGGSVASATAVEVMLKAFRESPPEWGASRRLYRAVQRANVEVYDKARVVPELRLMATTLTAVVVNRGILSASHVGDCRLYLARRNRITQISQDHTLVAEQVKQGLMTLEEARQHPERSVLLRNIGHDLVVSVARISMPLLKDDRVIVCSDGLYSVVPDRELERITRGRDADSACRALLDAAVERGADDDATCAVLRMMWAPAHDGFRGQNRGWRERLRSLLGHI